MSFSIGIVGLPNVGKSTLFKALTKIKVDIAAYPFTTIHPNVGVVRVPDERLDKIAQAVCPEKITPTIIEFVDVAGLVKGAYKGEGLGNQFLAQIRNCDAILEIVRGFEDKNIEHVMGEINPQRDMETIKVELLMKDLETLEQSLSKIEKERQDKRIIKKIELIKKIKDWISQGKLISELNLTAKEQLEIKEYQFLTAKPILYLLNTNPRHPPTTQSKYSTTEPPSMEAKVKKRTKTSSPLGVDYLETNLKDEEELSEWSREEKNELGIQSKLDQLIVDCYDTLDLITFFTVAGLKETRAWTLKNGQTTPEAGGVVHSDFQEKFIRAEVISWQKLVEAGNWKKAKELGQLKTVGKDYIVQDGDIIEFKI